MLKLSSLKDFFDLISSMSAAWPTIILVVGVLLPSVLALPLAAIIAIVAVVLLAAALLVYQLRRRFLYLPLQEASRKAYEQLEGTLWAEAAARMHDAPNPQKTLDYMGQLLVSAIPLHGTRPPSTVFKRIDEAILKRSVIKENCSALVSNDPKELPWTNLAVERSALKDRIKQMKHSELPPPKREDPNIVTITLPKAYAERHFPEKLEAARKQREQSEDVLAKMVEARDGSLMVINFLEGTTYQVDGKKINGTFEPRELALLDEAVSNLERQGLVRLVNSSKTLRLYKATAAGYRKVES
ncbi:hypothetical protein [Variovorax paradoxus]|uniref:hypothetical protein n=1 Tax=Variovorax paradoxus TaxID=34073 RepID=UPI003ECEE1EA